MTKKLKRCTCKNMLVLLTFLSFASVTTAATKNGFDLSNASIPYREILSGGPPKDGIPAINNPKFVSIQEITHLDDKDRILGLVLKGQARAYPINILDHHEIVNDKIGNQHFTVTYCPLCGTGMVFATNIGKPDAKDDKHVNALIFGVSGLLYNSDVLLYDRNTHSLWSQIMRQAISGKLKGLKLTQIPALYTSFAEWKALYPNSEVLSRDTGFNRSYKRSAYQGYEKSKRLWFKVKHKAPEKYHVKERVLGLEINGKFKAYPFIEMQKQDKANFKDKFGGKTVTIQWNNTAQSAFAKNEQGQTINSTVSFWFAWFAFHPNTQIFTADDKTQTASKVVDQ